MANTISFDHIQELPAGGFCCDVFSTKIGRADHLVFELSPTPGPLDSDAIALSLSTLCGRTYSTIMMELEVSERCAKAIEGITNANVTFKGRRPGSSKDCHVQGQNCVLNFSGGFDSLSAYSLMPHDVTKLVSIVWGGRFFREEQFFSQFSPFTMRTNIKTLGYCNETWTFMGIAMMLYAKRLSVGYGVFGGTVENTAEMMWRKPTAGRVCSTLPFSALGISDMRITHGLTEIGNVMVVMKHTPQFFAESLASVAAPRSEKIYRKYVLAHIINEKFGRGVKIPMQRPPISAPYKFGEVLTLDMLALYEMKNVGREVVEKTMSGIPPEVDDFVRKHSLTFYERLDTNFLKTIPDNFREFYLTRLAQAGVVPYDEEDWYELDEVCRFLTPWYSRLGLRDVNVKIGTDEKCNLIVIPEDHDLILEPRQGLYNWDYVSGELEPGRRYRLQISSVELLAGRVKHAMLGLYDVIQKKLIYNVTFSIEEAKCGFSSVFNVPQKSGKYRIIAYAGLPRQCDGVGISYRNVTVEPEVMEKWYNVSVI